MVALFAESHTDYCTPVNHGSVNRYTAAAIKPEIEFVFLKYMTQITPA